MRVALAAFLLVGCGRFGFSPGELNDATIGDGATTDATACAYQLCEGFESPTLDPIWDTSDTTAGSVTIDTSVKYSGASSVRFGVPMLVANAGHKAHISQYTTLPLGSPTVYVRAFMRFSGLPAAGNNVEIIIADEPVNGFENSLFVMATTLSLYNQWSDSTRTNGAAPAVDTWLCVLWRLDRATNTTGGMALGGDVAPVTLTNVQTEGPTLTKMIFGPTLYVPLQPNPQPAFDVWLDDLLIDDAPLTCTD